MFLLLASPAAALEKRSTPKYCAHDTVRDYLAPLKELPKLRSAPGFRRLPFGPSDLFLEGPPNLRERGGFAGYTLRALRSQPIQLDWSATLTLSRVDGEGRSSGRLRRRNHHVDSVLAEHRIGLRIPSLSGLYRYEIALRDSSGGLLGKYGEYFLLVEPERDVRVALNATTVRHGETVAVRVENHGTGHIVVKAPYAIEVYDGSSWHRSSISSLAPDFLVRPAAGPGGAVTCWTFAIPADAPPGRYRLVGEVMHSWARREARPTEIALKPEFEILPQ